MNKVPTNFWCVCAKVRKRGAQGIGHQHYFVTRAEEHQISDFIVEDSVFLGLEILSIEWQGKVVQP